MNCSPFMCFYLFAENCLHVNTSTTAPTIQIRRKHFPNKPKKKKNQNKHSCKSCAPVAIAKTNTKLKTERKIIHKFIMMEAPLASIDDFSAAFDNSQFRAYYKETFSKAKWCNTFECNARQKDLIGKLCRAEERSQSILVADNVRAEWNQYMSNRKLIKDIFIELLRHEMKFCRQHNVEQHVWKILYYNLIECARRLLGKQSNISNDLHQRQFGVNLIEDGRQFFCLVLDVLAKCYRYDLDDYIGVNGGQNLRGLKYISLALVSAQKCLMFLGDLMRYRELINDSSNFREAEQWYMKAYQLIPSNGMPWNQLAILALYNKKNFNAIFYHMRSLNASNPIKSARESLIILFDELHKRYQSQSAIRQNQSTQQQKHQQQQQQRQHCSKSNKRNRNENVKREIWVHPTDGQLNYRTVYLDQDNESMDANDLYKKFIFNFSHLHGVFFTKVGVDTLEPCLDQTLKQFQELLNHSLNTSSILTPRKMIQIIILNAYSIENDVQSSNDTLLVFVINFSFTFIAIILNQLQFELNEMATATKTMHNSNAKPLNIAEINDFIISDDINNSLAALSMWCNWMKIHWNVWTSDAFLMDMHKYTEQYGLYIWEDFARLATVLEHFNINFDAHIVVQNEPLQHCGEQFKRIRLPEDMIALGMTSVVRSDYCYCSNDVNEKNAFSLLRLQNIRHFCENELMNDDSAFLHRLDFGEIVATQIHRTDADSNDGCNLSMASLSFHDANVSQESVGHVSNATKDDTAHQPNPTKSSSDEVNVLLQRRNELKQTHQIQHELNKYTQNIVQQTSTETICIEIRPKYLITDTNCFIDFLPQINQLSHAYPMYNVLIPIVVLNELEGLAKGEWGSNVYDTPKRTSLNAHEALTFLKNAGSCMKCVTTRGSILQSMTFTKESDCATTVEGHTEPLSNDDKILLTAVNLTKIQSNCMIRDPKPINLSNLQRKVVLLTNDRNLKLKAIAQNIPVRELIDFIKWSNIVK